FARLGDTYRVFVPARGSYTYVIHHPDDVKRVLVSNHRNYTKGVGLDRVRILLGKGIMTSEGELWKRQRYMMQPFFHRRTVTEFAQRIAAVNERRLERWEQRARAGEIVNLTDEMSELTLEIVLRAILGLDLDRLTEQLGANPFEVVTRKPARGCTPRSTRRRSSRPRGSRRWRPSPTRSRSSTRRCGSIRPAGSCRDGLSRPTCSAATRCRPVPTCCCRCTSCTGTRASGRTRKPSPRSASRRSTRAGARALPTCRSLPAPAIASARHSRSTRCSCTCTRSRGTIG